jgi:hypothetical protein
MHATLDMIDAPCQGDPSLWESEPTTVGHGGYEGFWASSGAVEIVVDDDRIVRMFDPVNPEKGEITLSRVILCKIGSQWKIISI